MIFQELEGGQEFYDHNWPMAHIRFRKLLEPICPRGRIWNAVGLDSGYFVYIFDDEPVTLLQSLPVE